MQQAPLIPEKALRQGRPAMQSRGAKLAACWKLSVAAVGELVDPGPATVGATRAILIGLLCIGDEVAA